MTLRPSVDFTLTQINVHYSQYIHCAGEYRTQHRRKSHEADRRHRRGPRRRRSAQLGLIAIARFDLVAALFGMQFGEVSAASALVYALVGLAGLYQAVSWKRVQSRWAQPAAIATR